MSGNIIGQTLLNQFRVDAFVASGGMGAVYRVWDLKRNVPLAMKVLHADLAEDPSILKRFQREARALKKLTHPNIVQFYGLNQTSDFFFLLERYIDGATLKDILRNKRGPLPLEEALIYFTSICAALGFAHHSGVVHCDIKPANVMVDRGGNIYLTDFGIARHAESTVTSFAGAGTPAYMAPEQIREEVVSPATDVYALGVMLFEMLTGQRPFRGSERGTEQGGHTANERIRYAHLHLQPPDPRELNPSIPIDLTAVISKAMAKSPSERYQDATEFLDAVQTAAGIKSETLTNRVDISKDFQSQSPSIPQDLSAGGKVLTRQTPSRLNSRVAAIIGIFILLGVIGLFAVNQAGGSRSIPTEVIEENAVGIPTKVQTTSTRTLPTNTVVPTIHPNLSSNWIAYTYGTSQDSTDTDPRYLGMINIQTGQKKQLTYDDGGINFPSFSPDGDLIVYTGCKNLDCKLFILNIDTGKVNKITGINNMKAMWPAWCPDPSKNLIAFEGRVGNNWRIYVVDLTTNTVTAITNGPDDSRPSWSSDCTKIIFLRYFDNQNDVYVYDLNKGNEITIVSSLDDEFNAVFAPDDGHIIFTRLRDDTNRDGFLNHDDSSELVLIDSNGSNEKILSKDQYSLSSPSFSPENNSIVFTAFNGSPENQSIVVYSFSDGRFRSITSNGSYYHTDWSP